MMARKIRDAMIDSPEARTKLRPRGKPYWRAIDRGLHLGYRRLKNRAGTWSARFYLGDQQYEVEAIGLANDLSQPGTLLDGTEVVDFWGAVDKARSRLQERASHAPGRHKPLTVNDVMASYIEDIDNPVSAHNTGTRYRTMIRPMLGDIEVAKLTTEQIRRWHADVAKSPARTRTKPGAKPRYRKAGDDAAEAKRRRRATANRILTVLRAALNRAWREGLVPSDHAWRRVRPFKGTDAARVRYLSVAEAQRLINGADAEFRPLVQAALMTGARYSELIRLQVHDFNSDAGTVHVRRSKSGKQRHIVLTNEGAALFRELTAGRAGNALILHKADGAPWGSAHQTRPMLAACARAKINPPMGFHGLRHTWASLAVMAGVPLMIIARNLGHADTRMVEQHYGHMTQDYVVNEIRARGPTFGFAPNPKVATLRGA
jgi:integrase